MSFDVNKIIMESIQEVVGETPEKKVEEVLAPADKKEEVVAEEVKVVAEVDKKEDKKEVVAENIGEDIEESPSISAAAAAAISAGLGALSLRKKLASLNETK